MLTCEQFLGTIDDAHVTPTGFVPWRFYDAALPLPGRPGYYVAHAWRSPLKRPAAALQGKAGVVLLHAGAPVGTMTYGHLWLAAEHRGEGLGGELVAQFYATFHAYMLVDRAARPYPCRSCSPAGKASNRRAFALLCERGVIIAP